MVGIIYLSKLKVPHGYRIIECRYPIMRIDLQHPEGLLGLIPLIKNNIELGYEPSSNKAILKLEQSFITTALRTNPIKSQSFPRIALNCLN